MILNPLQEFTPCEPFKEGKIHQIHPLMR